MGGESCTILRLRLMHKLAMCRIVFRTHGQLELELELQQAKFTFSLFSCPDCVPVCGGYFVYYLVARQERVSRGADWVSLTDWLSVTQYWQLLSRLNKASLEGEMWWERKIKWSGGSVLFGLGKVQSVLCSAKSEHCSFWCQVSSVQCADLVSNVHTAVFIVKFSVCTVPYLVYS